jgi:hypothetical protein
MNRAHGDETGWDNIQRTVDKYLRVAKNMIDDCMATTGTEDFTAIEESRKEKKKTDSGVSFGSDQSQRPSTSTSTAEKPLPGKPSDSKSGPKGLSRLERITREFKRMRVKTRPDVEEIVKIDRASTSKSNEVAKDKKTIKKARSFANLGQLRSANVSLTSLSSSRKGSDAVPFDADEMRRHRKLYEASTTSKGSKNLL